MRKLIIASLLLLIITGCDKERFEKAKAIMEQESLEGIQVVLLFDNSISYKPFIEKTLVQVRDVFRYLATQYPGSRASLILIDSKATIIWSGLSQDLQKPYDELKDILQKKTSKFTNLIEAINKALYFLEETKAERKVLLIFSDMKHSTPGYYPLDTEVVPPPHEFPWQELNGVEIYAFFVPYKEWSQWKMVMGQKGVKIKGFLPEELKTVRAVQIIFKED